MHLFSHETRNPIFSSSSLCRHILLHVGHQPESFTEFCSVLLLYIERNSFPSILWYCLSNWFLACLLPSWSCSVDFSFQKIFAYKFSFYNLQGPTYKQTELVKWKNYTKNAGQDNLWLASPPRRANAYSIWKIYMCVNLYGKFPADSEITLRRAGPPAYKLLLHDNF